MYRLFHHVYSPLLTNQLPSLQSTGLNINRSLLTRFHHEVFLNW